MASPKRYRASLRRVHIRTIWMYVQGVKSENRTQEDWLSAANRELLPYTDVSIKPGGRVSMVNMEKPDEKVTLLLSFDAMCGIKHAVVQVSKNASFREREDILEAMGGFGPEFAEKVRKLAKLPESPDQEDEKELEGVPCEPELKIVHEAKPAEPEVNRG